jgi:hypothetical protein
LNPLRAILTLLLSPIGSNGFWTRGAERAYFDQQPLEAHAMIAACVEAYALTRDTSRHRAARRCFDWFLDRNDLGQPLYDASTGGCRDALHQDRVNQNQGAESTLAFHLSRAEMTRAEAVLYSETQRASKINSIRGDTFDQKHAVHETTTYRVPLDRASRL